MKNSSSDSADSSVVLRAGDVFVVESNNWLARAIRFCERSKDVAADANYNHAGIIYSPPHITFEALAHLDFSHLDDYWGCPVMIARPVTVSDRAIGAALGLILDHRGELYPFMRLPLHMLGVAHAVHFHKVVCSELVAKFIHHATGWDEFENWFGYDPAELADIFERWSKFEVIFKGIWRGNSKILVQ
jgi:hypothetical protein